VTIINLAGRANDDETAKDDFGKNYRGRDDMRSRPSGCNVHAATLVARAAVERGERAVIVTVLCDSAEKYLSEHFWDD